MNNNTYVASTVYHIYLILLQIIEQNDFQLNNKQPHLLILLKNTPNIETLVSNLENSLFFRKVVYVDEIPNLKKDLNLFSYFFNRKKIINLLENKFPVLKEEEDYIKKSQIYIGDSDSAKNYFYYKYAKTTKFIMFEDGSGTYVIKPSKLNVLKKKILKNGFTKNGFGNEVKGVIAVNPKKLPFSLRKKSIELNIKEIAKKLLIKDKKEIFKAFNFEYLKLATNKPKVLIIGSTLSEDKLVASEEDKIFIFKDIISKVGEENVIYFKHHPREVTTYNFNREVIFLPKLFPLEILMLDSSIVFEQGYSILSTALDNLDDTILEKHYVANDYLHLFIAHKKETKKIVNN